MLPCWDKVSRKLTSVKPIRINADRFPKWGPKAQALSQEMPVWFLTLKVPFLDFESFGQDIAQISTWEAFFIIKNIFITKTLTDFRKPLVNTRLLCLNKTWKLFVPTWKSVWYIMNGIGTDLEHVDYGHTHKTSNRCGLLRGLVH